MTVNGEQQLFGYQNYGNIYFSAFNRRNKLYRLEQHEGE